MSDDERALLAAVVAAPDDDVPRLVYADWLDEHGRPERAEFIRIDCEIARLLIRDPATASRYEKLSKRRTELVVHYREWEAETKKQLPPNRLTYFWFIRGLPGGVCCPAKYFVEHGEAILSVAPITALSLRRSASRMVSRIGGVPEWAQIQQLRLDTDNVDEVSFGAVLSLPLAHLRSFTLTSAMGYAYPPPEAWVSRSGRLVQLLAACEGLSGLRVLNLHSAGIGDEGVQALAETKSLSKLETLVLIGNHLPESACELLRRKYGDRVFFEYDDYVGRVTFGTLD